MQGMRKQHHPARDDIALPDVLYALSDPTRLKVVRALAMTEEELSCSCLGVDVAKSTLSHHAKVLRECGITYTRNEGTRSFLSLRRADLDARFPGLLDAIVQASESADKKRDD
jgi:DNA-binding transcriptional ArsR family regulator